MRYVARKGGARVCVQMDESEVSIRVELKSGRRLTLLLALSSSATCNDLVEIIKNCAIELNLTTNETQWNLFESWHGIGSYIIYHMPIQ